MVRLLAILCCCLQLCLAQSDYIARAEAALAVGERERAERLLHFALAAGDLSFADRFWVEGRLAGLQLHVEPPPAETGLPAVQRWRIERVLQGGEMRVADHAIFRMMLEQAPEDPLLRRIQQELLPDWVTATGHDEHGPWLGLTAGARLIRFRIVPIGRLKTDDGREIALRENILIAETPCTLAQWRGLFPQRPLPSGDLDQPLCGLTPDELQAAVAELDRRLGPARVRLPTAEEWAFAARAMCTGAFLVQPLMREDAVFERLGPQPVRRHSANAWGLYEVHGGVWELCREPDGTLSRRGGSWRSHREDCRLDRREPLLHAGADPTLGFRLVIEP